MPVSRAGAASVSDQAIVLDGAALAGRWLRMQGVLKGKGDVLTLIHGFRAGSLVSLATPSPCLSMHEGASLPCSALAWIPPNVDEVRIRWWARSTLPSPLRVEEQKLEAWSGPPDQAAGAQLSELLASVRKRYFWAAEVDWVKLERDLSGMAAAPAGLSLLPQMAAALLLRLPHHEHMAVRRIEADPPSPQAVSRLPVCRVARGHAYLSLPDTPGTPSQAKRFIEVTHACLRRASRQVTLDLRQSSGGDAQLMVAAAAPLLRPGVQFSYVNAEGENYDVVLTRGQVSLGGQVQYRFRPVGKAPPMHSVAVLVGPGCASACEALAIALRGNASLHGEPTAGLTTANETLPLDAAYALVVTSGLMKDRSGRIQHGPVWPDARSNARSTSSSRR